MENPRAFVVYPQITDKVAKMKRVKFDDPVEGPSTEKEVKKVKKHTLDSDEDDSSDGENSKQ